MHNHFRYGVVLALVAVTLPIGAAVTAIGPVSEYSNTETCLDDDTGEKYCTLCNGRPLDASVKTAKQSVCLVKYNIPNTNSVGVGTGILIKPNLVVSSMHVIASTGAHPAAEPEQLEVIFGYYYDEEPSETSIGVTSISPDPYIGEPPVVKDFVLLELAEDATTKGAEVAPVAWDWGTGASSKVTQAQCAFLLHHMDGGPMQISHPTGFQDASVAPNITEGGARYPFRLDLTVYSRGLGSSGGGVFNDDGELVGIERGKRSGALSVKDNLVIALPIDYIIDKNHGSTLAKSAFNTWNKETIPSGIWDKAYIFVLCDELTDGEHEPTSPHLSETLKWYRITPDEELTVDIAQIGATAPLPGTYEVEIFARASVTAAFRTLKEYEDRTIATISISGSNNTIEGKNTMKVSDLFGNPTDANTATFTQNDKGEAVSVAVKVKAKIMNVGNAKVKIKTTGDFLGQSVGAGGAFSLHHIQGERVADEKGRPVTSTGGGGGSKEWFRFSVLDGYPAPGVYVKSKRTGVVYDLRGRLVPVSGFAYETETAYVDGRTASIKGGDHWVTAMGTELRASKFRIDWGDGTVRELAYDDYAGALRSHTYNTTGAHAVKVEALFFDWTQVYSMTAEIGIETDVPSPQMVLVPERTPGGDGNLIIDSKSIPSFLIGQTEVTQAEYADAVGALPSDNFSVMSARHPVENVTFYDAVLYCNARSATEGLEPVYTYSGKTLEGVTCTGLADLDWDYTKNGYRLPRIWEWRHAYLGGRRTDHYWGTDRHDPARTDMYAWCADNSDGSSHSVAQKIPNGYGLYDIAGNVAEMVWNDEMGGIEWAGGHYALAAGAGGLDAYVTFWGQDMDTRHEPTVGFRVARNAPVAPIVDANHAYLEPHPADHYASLPQQVLLRSFESSQGGPLSSVLWDLGDGTYSNDRQPIHTFNTPGSHGVKVWGIGPGGRSEVATELTVDVGDLYYSQNFNYWEASPPTDLSEWLLSGESHMVAVHVHDGTSTGPHYKSTYLATTSPGGWGELSQFETSKFMADRTKGAGIQVRWKLRFASSYDPTDYGNQWRENNKVWISLCNDEGNRLYELMVKPNRKQDQYTSCDLELVKYVDGNRIVVKQGWTHQLTPYGPEAPFVEYCWSLCKDGWVFVDYDNGTNNQENYLRAMGEDTHRHFSKLHFQYKTGTGERNYSVQIDDVVVQCE